MDHENLNLNVKVFPLIPSLKKDVLAIDSTLSWDQLTASDINFAIVRPLVVKYAKLNNMAVVYACFVVRSYFIAQDDLAYAGVNATRANLCEILAIKLLRSFASNYLQLVAVLTTSWNPLTGADPAITNEVRRVLGGSDINYPQSALEMAISTKAKHFVSSPVTQRVVNDIYSGRVVFSMISTHSILADNYKPKPIEIYDYRKAPFLNHYRLRVPKYGNILEFLNFSFLLAVFLLCLSTRNDSHMTFWEYLFIIVACAFALAEYTASTEHGWIIYIANMWNVFDSAFILLFFVYLVIRLNALGSNDPVASELAFDILSCGACILFPRLAFFAVNNTVIIVSLRELMSEFIFFIGIACICFSGILFTLWTLGKEHWKLPAIAWLMVQIWFGNTSLSFAQASTFHPVFGPVIMIIFAALSNTLLLTILISILSNTVARIDANATQEHLFQFAINTIEGVKADALFSYQPPFNIVAFLILKPASWFVTPRRLHSMNVFLIKLTSIPILVCIALYERYWASGQTLRESSRGAAHNFFHSLPKHIKHMPLVEALVGSSSADLYEAIFQVEVEHESELLGVDEEGYDSDDALISLTSRNASPRRRQPRRPMSESPLRRSPRIETSALSLPVPQPKSPLARLFTRSASDLRNVEASVKKIEGMVDDIREMPVQRLRDEMKELKERQARIESLLMTLTRGMRNEK